ncbi:hypothetical protein LWI29_031817 [Acer saccharum]|uniref:TF-B3 domain-containing protein n=1 Tax=Acer saccharum TaxID=4024 RepID=A0AA39VRW5_ACESA|nr:hypothetical protein LWI29_021893 [Acer saccharum]KAK0590800.1 hypothetical protein LWI29_031817 [Acer saccharum]
MIVVKPFRGSTYMAIFTKTLSSSDIEWRLKIPGDCAAEFPPFHRDQHIEFNVKDESGHQWTFRCARQSAPNSGIVIISGWHEFVAKRKNLEVGDTIHFQKELDHSTRAHYRIRVTKKNRPNISE